MLIQCRTQGYGMSIRLSDDCIYDLCAVRARERRGMLVGLDPMTAPWSSIEPALDVVRLEPTSSYTRFVGKSAAQWRRTLARDRPADLDDWNDWIEWRSPQVRRELIAQLAGCPCPPLRDSGHPRWHYTLLERIRKNGPKSSTAGAWLKYALSTTEKGVSQDEIASSDIAHRLVNDYPEAAILTRKEVLALADYAHATPHIQQLVDERFYPSDDWQELGRLIKPALYTKRKLLGKWPLSWYAERYRHRSLGWMVGLACHSDLFTSQPKWWFVMDPKGIRCLDQPVYGFATQQAAMAHARGLMQGRFKRSAWGRHHTIWDRFSQQGFGGYAELLITLPDCTWTHINEVHFPGVRNIVVHLRVNVVESDDGWRLLFIDEAQTDWHMDIAKERASSDRGREQDQPGTGGVPVPFAKEWPLLALKTALWWAGMQGLDGVAWSPPELHLRRWRGLNPPTEVYRKGLPEAAARISRATGSLVAETPINHLRVAPLTRDPTLWQVLGKGRQTVCKPFPSRAQAETFARLTGCYDRLMVPMLLTPGSQRAVAFPLFGMGDPEHWEVEPRAPE